MQCSLLIFKMKQNVNETGSDLHFQKKNVKTCLENKKVYLMPHSRHGHFHLILIFLVKMVELLQQHANTVHWLMALPSPIVAKSPILDIAEFLDLPLKTSRCMETSLVSCENQSLWKVIRFFCVTFYSMMK